MSASLTDPILKAASPNPDCEKIQRTLRRVTSFLNAPSNLIGLIKIAQEFQAVVREFLRIAEPGQVSYLKELISECAMVQERRAEIVRYFPFASVDGKKHRKTLTDYYGAHPHYCIYWHRASEPSDIPHYRALLATLLPVFRSLDVKRQIEPSPFARWAERLGRSVRQLTEATGKEQLIVRDLPVRAQAPNELRRQFRELFRQYRIDPKLTNDYEKLAQISRMLDWFAECEINTGRGFGKRTSVSRRTTPKHGATETRHTEKCIELHLLADDGATARLSAYFERPDAGVQNEEAFDHDQEFDNAPTAITFQWRPLRNKSRVMNYGLANRRRVANKNAKYVAQAIEHSNQHLPVGRSILTGYELARFIDALEDLQLDVWNGIPPKSRAEVAAWMACRFYLGRDAAAVSRMETAGDQSRDAANIVWNPNTQSFSLAATPPRHVSPVEGATAATVSTCSAFRLHASGTLQLAMALLGPLAGPVFRRSFEEEFGKLIHSLNKHHSLQLTPKRLSATVPELINQLAPADRVFGHYFLGRPPNQHNPAVYSVVPACSLQSLFDAACAVIDHRIGRAPSGTAATSLPGMTSDAEDHVGSSHVPTKDAIRLTVSDLTARVARLARRPLRDIPEIHNTYTAYTSFLLLVTTGVRAVSALLPAAFDIDEKSGMAFISDKDTAQYRNSRVVLLHSTMIAQIRHYREHVTRLRQHLALLNPHGIDRLDARASVEPLTSHLRPKRDLDADRLAVAAAELFMLDDQTGRILPVSPSLLAQYVGPSWELRLAALRHFVRSDLLGRGLSGEVINALLGHGDRGEAPWGQFSTLPPETWRQQIEKVITQLLNSLGLRALPSPLLGLASGQ